MCYVRAWEHEEWGRFGSFEMLLVRHCWFQNFFVRVLSRRRLRFLGMEGCCGCCWSMGVQAVLLPLTVAWLLISDLLCWWRGGEMGSSFFAETTQRRETGGGSTKKCGITKFRSRRTRIFLRGLFTSSKRVILCVLKVDPNSIESTSSYKGLDDLFLVFRS